MTNKHRAIFAHLGEAPDPEHEDLYIHARQFPLVYDPDRDPEVQAFMEEAAKHSELRKTSCNPTVDPYDSELDSSDDEDNTEILVQLQSTINGDSVHQATARKKKKLMIVQKIHEIIVYIMRSEQRRCILYGYIQTFCAEEYKKLVPIKSMEVRWNSTLFEIDRAIKLKPALMHFISRLDAQYSPTSTAKAGQAARELRKRWELSEMDWEALTYLRRVLTVRDDLSCFHI